MFNKERLEKMLKEAKFTKEICEELLLEATINFQFNSSSSNKFQVEHKAMRVAEATNYYNFLWSQWLGADVPVNETAEQAQTRITNYLNATNGAKPTTISQVLDR